jgi:hypothetical protein
MVPAVHLHHGEQCDRGNNVTAVGRRSTSVYLSETSTIDDLAKAGKLEFSPELDLVAAAELQVYPAGLACSAPVFAALPMVQV